MRPLEMFFILIAAPVPPAARVSLAIMHGCRGGCRPCIRTRERESATGNPWLRVLIDGMWLERLRVPISNNAEESV